MLMLRCLYFLLSDGGKKFTKAGLKDSLEMSLAEWRNDSLWWLKTEEYLPYLTELLKLDIRLKKKNPIFICIS